MVEVSERCKMYVDVKDKWRTKGSINFSGTKDIIILRITIVFTLQQ